MCDRPSSSSKSFLAQTSFLPRPYQGYQGKVSGMNLLLDRDTNENRVCRLFISLKILMMCLEWAQPLLSSDAVLKGMTLYCDAL